LTTFGGAFCFLCVVGIGGRLGEKIRDGGKGKSKEKEIGKEKSMVRHYPDDSKKTH
jgi:hypothetical protein